MNEDVREILKNYKEDRISLDEAAKMLGTDHYEELGFATLDHDRERRRGFPEVVFCAGKTTEHVVSIMRSLTSAHNNVLATRATKEMYEGVKKIVDSARYNEAARTITVEKAPFPKRGSVLVVSAGTSDLPVVEEAKESAMIMGNEVETLVDVGVAGLHRILRNLGKLRKTDVIIVAAGMDGALPSVVAGLVDKPVIAVPTSVGYGANFGGIAPLLTMLNSCSAGIGVVNIDNGFGAAYLATLINKLER